MSNKNFRRRFDPPIDFAELKTYLRPKEAAIFMGVGVQTLNNWRSQKKGPKFVRIGRKCIRYEQEELIRFMEEHTVNPANSKAGDGGPIEM